MLMSQLTLSDDQDGMSPYGNIDPDDGPLEKIHQVNVAFNIENPDHSVMA